MKYSSEHTITCFDWETNKHFEVSLGSTWDKKPQCKFCGKPATRHLPVSELYEEYLTCDDDKCKAKAFDRLSTEIYEEEDEQ